MRCSLLIPKAVFATLAAWPLASSAAIYSCTDANGKHITSDRLIAECSGREQRILNPDGSVRRVIPPAMTADERAEQEARERKREAERAAQQDAVRRDRNLMVRFPSEAAHSKARNAALDDLRSGVQVIEKRLVELAAERKPLADEFEFYKGKPVPGKLRAQLDSNDAAMGLQRTLLQNQQHEIARINALFDAELERLKKLWAGATPGSLGTLPAPASAPAARITPASASATR